MNSRRLIQWIPIHLIRKGLLENHYQTTSADFLDQYNRGELSDDRVKVRSQTIELFRRGLLQENLDRLEETIDSSFQNKRPPLIAFTIPLDRIRSYNPNLNSLVLPIVHTPPPDSVCEIFPEPIADNPATIESLTKETTAHDNLSLPHPATPLVSYPYLMNSGERSP